MSRNMTYGNNLQLPINFYILINHNKAKRSFFSFEEKKVTNRKI